MKFDKISEVIYNGECFYVGQVGSFDRKDRFGGSKVYYLFTNKNIYGEMHINLSKYSPKYREVYKSYGIEELPDVCFGLENIDIIEKFQGKKFGSVLLNFALKEIEDYNNKNNCNYKLVFQRANSEQTLPFYKKFGARTNSTEPNDTFGDYCFMIIDKPKHLKEYESTKLLDGGLNK